MKSVVRYILVAVCVLSCLDMQAADRTFNSARFGALPQLRVSGEQGVSAPFAGVSNGVVLVAGGCNFPGVPASEGGRKVFYSDVYLLQGDRGWQRVGSLADSVV